MQCKEAYNVESNLLLLDSKGTHPKNRYCSSFRSVTTKASSTIQKPDNTKQKESDQAKTLGEPHNDAITIVDDLTSKVNSACRSSDTIIMLCTEEFQPQNT